MCIILEQKPLDLRALENARVNTSINDFHLNLKFHLYEFFSSMHNFNRIGNVVRCHFMISGFPRKLYGIHQQQKITDNLNTFKPINFAS